MYAGHGCGMLVCVHPCKHLIYSFRLIYSFNVCLTSSSLHPPHARSTLLQAEAHGCTVNNNSAGNYGAFFVTDTATLKLSLCSFNDNSATYGAALQCSVNSKVRDCFKDGLCFDCSQHPPSVQYADSLTDCGMGADCKRLCGFWQVCL